MLGLPFGAITSARRGLGSDVAGSRPYRPGDDVGTIDWRASARLSSATARDEFVVRERYAEEAPTVVIVCDRRPAMQLFPDELPWLSKPEAVRTVSEMIVASAARARGPVGYLHHDGADVLWHRPRHALDLETLHAFLAEAFRAPEDNVSLALDELVHVRRSLPPGSFVFVLSDFLAAPALDVWLRAREHGWDVVPVVIQDPVWEQSFPLLPAIAVPIVDASTGRRQTLRLGAREALERRDENERRLRELRDLFLSLGLDPVLVSSTEPEAILRAFLDWVEVRNVTGDRQWRLGA